MPFLENKPLVIRSAADSRAEQRHLFRREPPTVDTLAMSAAGCVVSDFRVNGLLVMQVLGWYSKIQQSRCVIFFFPTPPAFCFVPGDGILPVRETLERLRASQNVSRAHRAKLCGVWVKFQCCMNFFL